MRRGSPWTQTVTQVAGELWSPGFGYDSQVAGRQRGKLELDQALRRADTMLFLPTLSHPTSGEPMADTINQICNPDRQH